MTSKSLLLFMGALALTMTSCETENVSETNATARQASMTAVAAVAPIDNLTPCAHSELLAGQRYDAGDIKVYFDADNLYVEYQASINWHLRKTHLYVGDQRLIPLTRLGNPNVEFFPIQQTLSEGTQTVMYTFPKNNLRKCFIISAYAEVYKTDSSGEIVQVESAWSTGERFNEESWGMYFAVCQSDCSN